MMTPFDDAIETIKRVGYHNHRLETHSDTVSDGLFRDLIQSCEPLRLDVDNGVVRVWKNVSGPGDRLRKVDLFIGEPSADGKPDYRTVRIAVENKSVITAHRNRTSRFDDLRKVLSGIHSERPEAILIGTVLIGLCDRVLNIPDQVHKMYRDREEEFDELIKPRLSSGDHSLWEQFNFAVSSNRKNDPAKTLELLRSIPTRKPGHTHVQGFDSLIAVPVIIDNVNPPSIPRPNLLGIDIDAEYSALLKQTCSAYTARWHM